MPTYNMRIFLLEYIVNKFEDATLGDTAKERKNSTTVVKIGMAMQVPCCHQCLCYHIILGDSNAGIYIHKVVSSCTHYIMYTAM